MAKVNYYFKVYLLRDEFKLTSKENKNPAAICLFACLVYAKAHIFCTKATDGSVNNLYLLTNQAISKFEQGCFLGSNEKNLGSSVVKST